MGANRNSWTGYRIGPSQIPIYLNRGVANRRSHIGHIMRESSSGLIAIVVMTLFPLVLINVTQIFFRFRIISRSGSGLSGFNDQDCRLTSLFFLPMILLQSVYCDRSVCLSVALCIMAALCLSDAAYSVRIGI